MKKIETTVRSFLISSLFFLLLSVVFLGLLKYTSYESLFIPPEDSKHQSVNLLLESTNLESIKKACLFMAETNNYNSRQIDELIDLVYMLLESLVFGTMALSVFFGYGFLRVYLKLKNVQSADASAP